jgi:methionine-rich copper-binding protein CopC
MTGTIAFATRGAMAGLLLLAIANPVWAHAFLEKASPPVGSQSPVSPAELTLRFTEPVEPLFCAIQLLGPSGAAIEVAAPKPIENAQGLVVALPKLQAGTYTVVWHVTSVDTHKTEGRFQFSVGP